MLSPKQFTLLRRILARTEQGERADLVMKDELARARLSSSLEKTVVANGVATYFRWRGWLDRSSRMESQIASAFELQEKFDHDSSAFRDEELKAKAVPQWVHRVGELSPGTLRAFQSRPKLWLRSRPGQAKALAEKLGDCLLHGSLLDALEYTGCRDLFLTPEFHKGEFEIQDISSQAVGLICAPKPGQTWRDACAGEGGKTLHLADLMQNKGLIWATDPAEWRLSLLKRRASRASIFNYRTKVWPDSKHSGVKGPVDGILVDAPCSGIGTWQRNPQARWTTTAKDVQELAAIQKQILSSVAGTLKPNGRLIYSVCTLSRDETTGVAEDITRTQSSLERLAIPNPFNQKTGENCWLYPEETGGIAMYLAAWRRA
jgi:16S rRNA (cytosine967-C5)-methyltransferase